MTGGTDGYIGTYHDLLANIHIHIIYDDQIEIGIKLIPQMNMITVRHMYRTFNKHTVRTMPENFLLPTEWYLQQYIRQTD